MRIDFKIVLFIFYNLLDIITNYSAMSSISIGSSKLILAEFRKGAVNQAAGVDIVPNHEQEQSTQVCTTWVKDKARQFGKSAKHLMKRYPD